MENIFESKCITKLSQNLTTTNKYKRKFIQALAVLGYIITIAVFLLTCRGLFYR